jgi:hypothetical protein
MEIVCFIASVIRDERRLSYFRQLLNSIRAQTRAPARLYILFSDDDDLWHPQRVACYLNWFDNVIQMGTPPDVMSRMTDNHRTSMQSLPKKQQQ